MLRRRQVWTLEGRASARLHPKRRRLDAFPLAMQIQQPFMNRQLLLSQFEKLLPLATNWAAAVERRILREGVPLSEQGLADARSLGVREPERVRLLALDSVPTPTDLTLRTAVAAIQCLTPATRGLALRYGIFVRSDCWGERRLIAHELVHTAQYERLGGIRPFLRQYLSECLTVGYPAGPMEQEAIATANRLDIGHLA
jgi:hypothetical protein